MAHYLSLFQFFFQSTMVPAIIKIPNLFVLVRQLEEKNIVTGEPIHTASKESNGIVHPFCINCLIVIFADLGLSAFLVFSLFPFCNPFMDYGARLSRFTFN